MTILWIVYVYSKLLDMNYIKQMSGLKITVILFFKNIKNYFDVEFSKVKIKNICI